MPRRRQAQDQLRQQGADALIAAAGVRLRRDWRALRADGNLVVTGDTVQDKIRLDEFAAAARERRDVTVDPKNANRAIISVGSDLWPLPIPLVKHSGRWSFDAASGRAEILYRRIGGNELDAIQVCRGLVEAQHEYALTKHDKSTVNEYAHRVVSTPGTHDGLAWQNSDGSWDGPVGEAVARAIQQGYAEKMEPYHGYFFKVLTGQGPAAPLGTIDFLVNGAMIGGFALVASPAEYGVTGVQTFIVSHDGVVYQQDFGAQTLNTFKTMERYNPDKSWTRRRAVDRSRRRRRLREFLWVPLIGQIDRLPAIRDLRAGGLDDLGHVEQQLLLNLEKAFQSAARTTANTSMLSENSPG
jgi:hypothetical protein